MRRSLLLLASFPLLFSCNDSEALIQERQKTKLMQDSVKITKELIDHLQEYIDETLPGMYQGQYGRRARVRSAVRDTFVKSEVLIEEFYLGRQQAMISRGLDSLPKDLLVTGNGGLALRTLNEDLAWDEVKRVLDRLYEEKASGKYDEIIPRDNQNPWLLGLKKQILTIEETNGLNEEGALFVRQMAALITELSPNLTIVIEGRAIDNSARAQNHAFMQAFKVKETLGVYGLQKKRFLIAIKTPNSQELDEGRTGYYAGLRVLLSPWGL